MKTSRTIFVLRWIVIFTVTIGWLLLSNHCILRLRTVAAGSGQAHACCHNGTAGSGGHAPGPVPRMTCCQGLQGLPADGGSPFEIKNVPFVYFSFAWLNVSETQAIPALPLRPVDTGPPRAASFSELVLQRSLRAHAPPFFA